MFLLSYPVAHSLSVRQLIPSRLQIGQLLDIQIEGIHQGTPKWLSNFGKPLGEVHGEVSAQTQEQLSTGGGFEVVGQPRKQ